MVDAASAAQSAVAGAGSTSAASTLSVSLGVYDPDRAFHDQSALSKEHYFLSWHALDRTWARSLFRYAKLRNRPVLATVEPFRRPGETGSPTTHLRRIAAGTYNAEIKNVCGIIGEQGSTVLVRWGHEMDDTSGRYPWAGGDPYAYITAFRYFRKVCLQSAPLAKFVWSPIASKDPSLYYPGSSFVDIIGLPIWGLQKLDMDYYRRGRSFSELLGEKYRYVASRNKPVIVAEFGASGDRAYREAVFSGIQAARKNHPLLRSVLYFNMKEPFPWWSDYGTPDWRVDPDWYVALATGTAATAAR